MNLHNNIIVIHRSDGTVLENVAASVQGKNIFIKEVKTPIEEGDTISQVLPSGLTRRMLVIDVAVYAVGSSTLDHIEVKVTNL